MLNILQSKRFVKFQITEIDDDVQVRLKNLIKHRQAL